jgi:hypothetical protein
MEWKEELGFSRVVVQQKQNVAKNLTYTYTSTEDDGLFKVIIQPTP